MGFRDVRRLFWGAGSAGRWGKRPAGWVVENVAECIEDHWVGDDPEDGEDEEGDEEDDDDEGGDGDKGVSGSDSGDEDDDEDEDEDDSDLDLEEGQDEYDSRRKKNEESGGEPGGSRELRRGVRVRRGSSAREEGSTRLSLGVIPFYGVIPKRHQC